MNATAATPTASAATEWVELDWGERHVRIEHQWLQREDRAPPLLVFLHEGLGLVSTWRYLPQTLCDRLQCRGLVYSRPGYGQPTPKRSTARTHTRRRTQAQRGQALEVMALHPLARLRFDNCRIAAHARIGMAGEGSKVAMRTLHVFRTWVAATALGFACCAMDEDLRRATSREMVGHMLADCQLTQAKLAQI